MPNLPTNIDTTYADSAADASQKSHQQHHDALHTRYNSLAGVILAYAGANAPTGALLCDGSVVSRTTYATLFAAIGTAFGVGDGSTTFGIPDLRGRAVVGVDGTAGRLSANDTLAATAGTETSGHTHTGPSHTHGVGTLAETGHTHTGPSHTHTSAAHSHTATPGTIWAQLTRIAIAGVNFFMNRVNATSYTATHQSSSADVITTSTTAEATGVGVDGATDSTTPAATGAAGTGVSGSTADTLAGASAAAGTGASGSSAPNTMPPYQVLNYIILTGD